jgi:hypothetical protein
MIGFHKASQKEEEGRRFWLFSRAFKLPEALHAAVEGKLA